MAAKPTTRLCSWTLLIAMAVVVSNVEYCASAINICPEICLAGTYMICPSSGGQKLEPACNCCMAPPGCKVYDSHGTLICTAT